MKVRNTPELVVSATSRKKQINFKKLYLKLEEKGGDSIDKLLPREVLRTKIRKTSDAEIPIKVYIHGGYAVVAKGNVVLATDWLHECAALKIIDPTSCNLHYLLHGSPSTFVTDIIDSLSKAKALGINLKDSEIEIMPGRLIDILAPSKMLEALYKFNSHLLDKVVLIRDFNLCDDTGQGLATYNGKTYRYPSRDMNYDFECHCVVQKLARSGFEVVLQ